VWVNPGQSVVRGIWFIVVIQGLGGDGVSQLCALRMTC